MVGRQKKTVVQKHRVKTLYADWNALKQKLRLSVLPAHERNSPTQITQKRSVRLIDRTQGLECDQLKIIVSPQSCVFRLCEKLPSPPHSQDPARRDQCKSAVVQTTAFIIIIIIIIIIITNVLI